MTNVPGRWMEQARYDFDTAKAMFESGRYLYVLFCCQQAVEKALKAVIVKRTEEFPPRVHSLMRLAEYASLEPSEERAALLRELSAYYIQTRYPEEIENSSTQIGAELCLEILHRTEEVFAWLSSLL
ncbi:MAG TPA: HEPN domain-containing protein [Thermodesulfobacteriota bacterium]|nr:HEPN domain-containing protein [Deltaproteobacteria bacterium]HNR12930.1 HEPN domain-containing protein [Thermodesulfobacteriota bacterium]HNU72658.1 HEPN domain-containing protein [Thermodesulfobacteriota bacterium]HOC38880.1 HEPN domain-containing protein [Thermodesulfobacteriota bacterium]HQO79013.1 HEPN domain-containing protein [Thermodesulfobacteriota bacterium]